MYMYEPFESQWTEIFCIKTLTRYHHFDAMLSTRRNGLIHTNLCFCFEFVTNVECLNKCSIKHWKFVHLPSHNKYLTKNKHHKTVHYQQYRAQCYCKYGNLKFPINSLLVFKSTKSKHASWTRWLIRLTVLV